MLNYFLPISIQLKKKKKYRWPLQISYHIDANIDIEKPTEKSDAFHIYLYGRGSAMHHIDLPIHFRYHAPGNRRWEPRPANNQGSLNQIVVYLFGSAALSKWKLNIQSCLWRLTLTLLPSTRPQPPWQSSNAKTVYTCASGIWWSMMWVYLFGVHQAPGHKL